MLLFLLAFSLNKAAAHPNTRQRMGSDSPTNGGNTRQPMGYYSPTSGNH